MKCLALDTSTPFLSVAVSNGTQLWFHHQHVGQKHAERILPCIENLLQHARLALSDIETIAIGQGPGSFTGLRIACGIAQGLAFATEARIMCIPCHDSIIIQCPAIQPTIVCVDARIDQIYYAFYQPSAPHALELLSQPKVTLPPHESSDRPVCVPYTHPLPHLTLINQWERIGAIRLGHPAEISFPHADSWALAGQGLERYRAFFPANTPLATPTCYPTLGPHAYALIALANSGVYPPLHPRDAELLYIRDKVALTNDEQRAVRSC